MASSFGFRATLVAAVLLLCGAATPQPNQPPQPAAAKPFEVLKLEVAAEQAAPEACFLFPARIDRSGKTPIESFVQIEPAVKASIAVRDERLCVGGLSHGGNWKINLLPGLPGVGGVTLAKAQSFAVQVPNRSPSVAFASRGTVLPRSAAQGLPLRTVNADKVAIQILRVRDRDLLQRLRNGSLDERLSRNELDELAQNEAERVWQGELETKGDANQAKLTSLPIGETIGELKPGLYVAIAMLPGAQPARYEAQATQWFTVADLGLAAYHGPESLVVSARSLASAQAIANIELALVAENNRELVRVRTDGEGLARFDPGLLRGTAGDKARAVYAYGDKGEFAFLDLADGRVDLTDRGVGGRTVRGPTEAFLYAERGIYRPGETARVTVLLRDEQARALPKTPLTIKIRRPDGVAFDQRVVQEQAVGGATFDVVLPPTARTGGWTVQAYLDAKADAIGSVEFLVEDFVPPRVEFDLRTDAALLVPQQPAHVAVDARYLYGAPAGELPGDLSVTLKPAEQPFPAFPGYAWGLVQEETLPTSLDPITFTTDAQGKADIELKLDRVPNTTRPLEAQLVASIFDAGGRPVERTQTVAVANLSYALGLKASFTGSATADQPIFFDAIAVAPDGARIDKDGLAWDVLREDIEYFWYRAGRSWDYRSSLRTTRVASGTSKIAAAAPSRIETALPPGQYRIELHDASGTIATSLRFSVGGWVVAGADSAPDKVTVTPTKPNAAPGEAIDVFIRPPYDSDVVIAVADTAVRSTQVRRITKDGANVRVELPKSSPAGAYVLATAYAPPDAKATRLPRRAIGTAWLGVDAAPRTLDIKLDAPPLWRPQQQVKLPLTVANAGDEQVQVTVAAVDDGVLQLTEYAPPNANEFWFGKRLLGVAITDLYGRVIDPTGAARGKVKSGGGGDSALNRQLTNLPQRTTKVVSLFSGLVAVDKSGKAEITLDLPDFDGRLRLMAVAWSATKLGHADATVEVRHPVVADLSLPRFLAPDDRATLNLTLDNTDAPRGAFTAKVTAEGAVAIEGDGMLATDLAQKERRNARITLRGNTVGEGLIRLAVTGPNGLKFDRVWPISVRPGNPTVTRRNFVQLKPGTALTVDPALGAGLRPETSIVAASVSPLPDFDLPGLARALEAYPYGCAEQVVSRASPFLYARDVLQALGRPVDIDPVTNPKLRDAIARSLSLQARSGSFSLWAADDDDGTTGSQIWLTAYVMDFLGRARAQGAYVPQGPFEQGVAYLARAVDRTVDPDDKSNTLNSLAYAHYVLAREQRADPFRLRYFADQAGPRLKSPVAAAELGAAFALVGDAAAARTSFQQAASLPLVTANEWVDYGSDLRNQAALTALLAEAKVSDAATITAAAEKTQQLAQQKRPLSTQEQAWLLRAGKALLGQQPAAIKLEVDGKATTSTGPYFAEQRGGVGKLPAIKNAGSAPLYASVAVTGVAIAPESKENKGFDVQRQIFDRTGQPVNPAQVRQNDLLVVLLTGRFTGVGRPNSLLVDMLPAGWEIETPDLSNSGQLDRFEWLGELSPVEHAEARDDRFVAVPQIPVGEKDKKEFRVAYVVRAVTPGTFQLPGPYIEDMTRPYLFGRGAAANTTVVTR
ncbi:alpha-2-macroglobulin family protein [Roseiterribacter gracilis]|uniref:Alpha-2-macroglobulin n=1 Tax=Roseiterribacter gracilis TaxID=2812848 RepID=A0A8S8XIP0_9PROT|nr:alpha-2-macroglobulin [Rhodospirillales bacterium TMPK1]